MSSAVEECVERALAALEDLSARELEASAEQLTSRTNGLREFGLVFRDAVSERERSGWGSPRQQLQTAIARADDRVSEIIESAPHPFWVAVRKALEA